MGGGVVSGEGEEDCGAEGNLNYSVGRVSVYRGLAGESSAQLFLILEPFV